MKNSIVGDVFYYVLLAVFPFVFPLLLVVEIVGKLSRRESFAVALTKLIAIPCISIIAASYLGIGVGLGAFY